MENQPNQNYLSGNNQMPLPNATAVLVLGIISIVGCFCYGVVGAICGIIAMVLANKDKALYLANPGDYTQGSYNNLKAGRTCAIIGLIMSALYLLAIIAVIAFFGFAALSDPQSFMQNMQTR
jgi:M penetrans paralogue family 26